MKKRMMILFLFGALVFGALPAFAATIPIVDSSKMNLRAINSIEASRGIPVGTVIVWSSPGNPDDSNKWLECDGRSTAGYPELAAIIGGRTPDYRDQFLRGGGIGQVGQVAQDTTRSHYHRQPSHTHSVDARLTSTAVSGTAAGQKYYDMKSGMGKPSSNNIGGSAGFIQHANNIFGDVDSIKPTYTFSTDAPGTKLDVINPSTTAHGSMSGSAGENSVTVSGSVNVPGTVGTTARGMSSKWIIDGGEDYAASSSVSANVNNGASTGTAHSAGADDTYENSNNDGTTGGAETAPQHIRVRYLIRASL